MNPLSGRRKHNTPETNVYPDRVIIINPISPLCGKSVTVRKAQRLRPDYVELSVDHPDGGFLALPLADTLPVSEELDVSKSIDDQMSCLRSLLRLAELVYVRLTGIEQQR